MTHKILKNNKFEVYQGSEEQCTKYFTSRQLNPSVYLIIPIEENYTIAPENNVEPDLNWYNRFLKWL